MSLRYTTVSYGAKWKIFNPLAGKSFVLLYVSLFPSSMMVWSGGVPWGELLFEQEVVGVLDFLDAA